MIDRQMARPIPLLSVRGSAQPEENISKIRSRSPAATPTPLSEKAMSQPPSTPCAVSAIRGTTPAGTALMALESRFWKTRPIWAASPWTRGRSPTVMSAPAASIWVFNRCRRRAGERLHLEDLVVEQHAGPGGRLHPHGRPVGPAHPEGEDHARAAVEVVPPAVEAEPVVPVDQVVPPPPHEIGRRPAE